MASRDPFFEEGSRLLTPHAFDFVLGTELKRVVRAQNVLTLLVLEAQREWDGIEFAPNDSIAGEFLLDDDRPDTAGLLIEALAETAAFDVACLNGFEPGSPVLHAVLERARARRLGVEAADHAYAMVDLRAGYEAYRRRLSAHYRRNLAQKARKIGAAGDAVGGVLSWFTEGFDSPDLRDARAALDDDAVG